MNWAMARVPGQVMFFSSSRCKDRRPSPNSVTAGEWSCARGSSANKVSEALSLMTKVPFVTNSDEALIDFQTTVWELNAAPEVIVLLLEFASMVRNGMRSC